MTAAYEKALEYLYQTFAIYPRPTEVLGCPCCVTTQDQAQLQAHPVRQLQSEHLQEYTWSALTTWGTLRDFKYYLPRILELFTRRTLSVDDFVVAGKLAYAKWTTWPVQEQAAIQTLLYQWWLATVHTAETVDFETLLLFPPSSAQIAPCLNEWNLALESRGYRNFVALVEYLPYHKTPYQYEAALYQKAVLEYVFQWATAQIDYLEEGFFYYEKQDSAFAARISNALYWLERLPPLS
jgi:hypothetical protein